MAGAEDRLSLVPGFDFLQNLFKSAGASLPPMGQWMAPTLDPVELDKRIQELKTVQFWLEQNARLLTTTIQTMEVQRMTLNTLQSMNLPMSHLGEALKIRVPAPAPAPEAEPEPEPAQPSAALPGLVDPMQWWGALTQQFTELASKALQDVSAERTTSAAAAPEAGTPTPATPAPGPKPRTAPRKRAT